EVEEDCPGQVSLEERRVPIARAAEVPAQVDDEGRARGIEPIGQLVDRDEGRRFDIHGIEATLPGGPAHGIGGRPTLWYPPVRRGRRRTFRRSSVGRAGDC